MGFTLTELLVAMTLAGIVMAAIYSTYTSQQKAQVITEDVSSIQQNLRAAMYMMGREIRMAGYDPKDAEAFGFHNVTGPVATTIEFSYDGANPSNPEPNGARENPAEHIRYRVNSNQLQRMLGSGTWQPVAENISGVTFQFLNGSGVTTASTSSIASVEVSLSGSLGGHERAITTRIYCRNMQL